MNKILKNFTHIIIFILAFAAVGACSSHKAARTSDDTSSKISKRVRAKNIPEVAALASTYTGWETFYAPFTLRCSQPISLSVSGRATMVRDQYIYMSMRMIGFEVAAFYVDSDSAYFADKYHKTLVVEPLAAVTARTGLTVGDLQDILMGRAFYPGQGTLCLLEAPETMFSPQAEGDLTILMPRRLPEGASWFFTIDKMLALQNLTVEPDGYSPVIVNYAEPVESPAGAVSTDVMLTAAVGDRNVEAMCQWNLDKAKWNESVNTPDITFKGYRRVSVRDLMGALRY